MQIVLGILIGVVLGGISIYLATRKSQSFLMLQQQLHAIDKRLDEKLGESGRMMQNQFGESARIIRDVTERLTKLDETNKQVLGFGEQLQQFQDILKNPKQRGTFGEYQLETLLQNIFPPKMFKMQYEFRDGIVLDASILVKYKIIPIDSKFSLENYNRIQETRDPQERERLEKVFKHDLKTRIDETAKYVRPEENTMDFAFMFIPAEGIYYDLLVNQVGTVKTNTRDLIDYAFIEKKVHIVSPTTLLSHLKMVFQGLRMLQIEESAKEIQKRVGELSKHISAYNEYFLRLGKSLDTTVNTYNRASRELKKVDSDVLKISGEGGSIEPRLVGKTEAGEEVEG
ncbi:MAG: DNA recombination protein RmuC [Candidatus Niyogibacteria bacterium]|nr:DNA recombination protein RmuC [Candidatus Niyogibacteria bacterium]